MLFLIATSTSCIMIFDCIDGNGIMRTEERTTSSFTAVANETSFHVVYQKGETVSVTVEAESNILPYIETSVRGGALEICKTRGTLCLRTTIQPVIIVTAPNIEELVNSGSGDIVSDDLAGEEVKVINSGSGDISAGDIYCNIASIVNSGSGEIETGYLETTSLRITLSGSGTVETPGSAVSARYILSGSGTLYSGDLVTDDTKVTISGSGSVYTTVLEYLEAVLSGSGNVYLTGDPELNVVRSGSGRVIYH